MFADIFFQPPYSHAKPSFNIVTYGISVYTTPALDMQFGNFMITDYVPEKGEEGGKYFFFRDFRFGMYA